jgi:F0F1-type ATP synthase membrane subunit a
VVTARLFGNVVVAEVVLATFAAFFFVAVTVEFRKLIVINKEF